MEAQPVFLVGVYGWRKRCLYLAMLILLFVITLNITLVIWFMKVLHFNSNGMSYLHMTGGGVQFAGKTYVNDLLVASMIFTREGESISFQAAKNLTLRATDHSGTLASNMYIGDGRLEMNTPCFKVTEPRGKTVFSVDKDTVSLAVPSLVISGQGGAVLEGSLQTPILSADIRSDLVLESVTKEVLAVTPAGVSLESRAGDIIASSSQDITLVTIDGSIKLESRNVLFHGLRGPHHMPHSTRKHHNHVERIYQVCVCLSGELYLAEADTHCEATAAHTELCL